MLYCPNYTCQTPNPEPYKYCQKCRTPLPKHYLWSVGENVQAYRAGDMLANRYLCKESHIFLDTKPGLLAIAPADIPNEFIPYLKLSPYRLHVPQIYEWVQPEAATPSVLLLDHAALYVPPAGLVDATDVPDVSYPFQVYLLPALVDVWQQATAFRQLNWLWQIAQLWYPCSSEAVTSSLLNVSLLRVEGSVIKLLELQPDATPTTLPQLGHLWSQWVSRAKPEIAKGLEQLCQKLTQGQIRNAELLIDELDRQLAGVERSPIRSIQITTQTDQGPSRQRNEDACYPPSGTERVEAIADAKTAIASPLMLIVCDGIGGHQGGDVASNLAIETVRQQLQLLSVESMDSTHLMEALEQAIWAANDIISQRNDQEQRYERQRMGTTLVVALMRGYELYLAHVGDSRAYWITQWGCHQVTLDDDVASREVRLGYSIYREALQQPAAGSLVQALGMGSSTALHPTVQRFLLDEGSIFLVCSDGLSDQDRVEEIWDTVLLPVLEGSGDVVTAREQLVHIANTYNGHDNVTVGLLYCQIATAASMSPQTVMAASPSSSAVITESPRSQSDASGATAPPPSSALKTQLVAPRASVNDSQSATVPLLVGIAILLGIAGGLLYLFFPGLGSRINPSVTTEPFPNSPAPTEVSPPILASPVALDPGILVQIQLPSGQSAIAAESLILMSRPATAPAPDAITELPQQRVLPSGSVVQVVRKQGDAQGNRWVLLQICSVPGINQSYRGAPQSFSRNWEIGGDRLFSQVLYVTNVPSPQPPAPALLRAGEQGWIQEAELAPYAVVPDDITADQQGDCVVSPLPPTSPIPDVTPSPTAPGALS